MHTEIVSKRDVTMLHRALEVAKNSSCKQKHGALIYKAGRVLAIGFNKKRNEHPSMTIEYQHYTTHAEIDAMKQVNEADLRGATIYVARANGLNSAPCRDCQEVIEAAGIKRVVITQ